MLVVTESDYARSVLSAFLGEFRYPKIVPSFVGLLPTSSKEHLFGISDSFALCLDCLIQLMSSP